MEHMLLNLKFDILEGRGEREGERERERERDDNGTVIRMKKWRGTVHRALKGRKLIRHSDVLESIILIKNYFCKKFKYR